MKKPLLILIPLFVLLLSCKHYQKQGSERPDGKSMIEMNRYLLTKDRELILNYCERKSIEAKETPTGLWYSVVKEGSGNTINEGEIITFDYECSLLDGTICYSTSEDTPRTTRLGYSEMESGLLEGIKLMSHGSEFIFIIPPYLAHGVRGDGNKIPGRSVVVYRIKLK